MSSQRRKGFRAIAVFLAFAMVQVYIQLSLAEPTSSVPAAALPQQFIARLTTSGGPIIVNGLSASNGASLVTGARIQTPAAVSATVDLGPLGTLTLQPDSDVRLERQERQGYSIQGLLCAEHQKGNSWSGRYRTAGEGGRERSCCGWHHQWLYRTNWIYLKQ
jgi:hypothetical protein